MIKIKLLNKGNQEAPVYATPQSAGMDLRANIEKPITINPMDAYANFVMGSLYCSTDTENAKNYLTRAIRYDSKLERAYLNRGQLYYKESSFREAINDFSKVSFQMHLRHRFHCPRPP